MERKVPFTQDQYDRYKAAFKVMNNMDTEPTEEQLTLQLKREASAITYSVEVGTNHSMSWQY